MFLLLSLLFILHTFIPGRYAFSTQSSCQRRLPLKFAHRERFHLLHSAVHSRESFHDLYSNLFPPWLLDNLEKLNYHYPNEVQRASIELCSKGKDIIINTQTGSGKTLAYLLPALFDLDCEKTEIQTIIIVPTEELGTQVERISRELASPHVKTRLVLARNTRPGQSVLTPFNSPQLVICETTALSRFLSQPSNLLRSVKHVVIDEADSCLLHEKSAVRGTLAKFLSNTLSSTYQKRSKQSSVSVGSEFKEYSTYYSSPNRQAQKINQQHASSHFTNSRQTIFCSATFPQKSRFAEYCASKKWTQNPPVLLSDRINIVPPAVRHEYIAADEGYKKSIIRHLLYADYTNSSIETFKALVTVNRQQYVDVIEGVQDAVLRIYQNYNKNLTVFEMVSRQVEYMTFTPLRQFKETNSSSILVCDNDMFLRGIDIPDLSHVFLTSLPSNCGDYIHLSGRTGRFGQTGKVVSIIDIEQKTVMQSYCNAIRTPIRERLLKLKTSTQNVVKLTDLTL